jgi:hypothetical protein
MTVVLCVAPRSLVNIYQTTRRYIPQDSHVLSSVSSYLEMPANTNLCYHIYDSSD